jgi:hypothetical protein
MAESKTLLIALTSDSDHKTLRFMLSLTHSLKRTDNRRKWGQIVILRTLPYNKQKIRLDRTVASQLTSLNVLFLQPQVHIDETHQYHRFLFARNTHSYSTAAQRNRQLLAVNDWTRENRVDLIAVLDDDLLFQNAQLTRDGQGDVYVSFDDAYDYLLELDKMYELAKAGPIAGGNTGCPPIPGLLGIRGALTDFTGTFADVSSSDLIAAQACDYYYDFSDRLNSAPSRGAWIKYYYNSEYAEPSSHNVLWGVTPTRPLIFNKDALLKEIRPGTNIGGNTYFSNSKELLFIPHLSLTVEGVSTRRSDMIVAEIARSKGIIYQETYFPLGHLRLDGGTKVVKEVVCRIVESELFGVSFHRGVRSFVQGGDYRKEWEQIFQARRDSLIANLIFSKTEALRINNDEIGAELALLCDPEYVSSHLLEKYSAYFEKYEFVLDNLDQLQRHWIDLMRSSTCQVEY